MYMKIIDAATAQSYFDKDNTNPQSFKNKSSFRLLINNKTNDATHLIAVKLPLCNREGSFVVDEGITAETVSRHLGEVVQGTRVELGEQGDELGMWCDVEKVKKAYKLGNDGSGTKKGKKGVVE